MLRRWDCASCTRRHGTTTTFRIGDAPQVGLTAKAVDAHAWRHGFDRPYPGVIIVPGYPADHRTLLSAVQLHLGTSAAASDLSAAWLYDLVPRPPARPHLLLPHARRVTPRGTVIHRSRYVEPTDRTMVDGISTVTPVFLMIAIAPRAEFMTLTGFGFALRQRGLLCTDALAARLDAVGRVPGRRRVLQVMAQLSGDDSDSLFESKVRDRLREAGLRPSAGPHPVVVADGRTVHLDIAFPEAKVAIECQGHVAHSTPQQMDRDARRDNAIALAGHWVVLKLTWRRFVHGWDAFLAELCRLLASRA